MIIQGQQQHMSEHEEVLLLAGVSPTELRFALLLKQNLASLEVPAWERKWKEDKIMGRLIHKRQPSKLVETFQL